MLGAAQTRQQRAEDVEADQDAAFAARLQGIPGAFVVRPPGGRTTLELRELWDYRELVYFLVWRDIKVRYKQTVLGVAWALLQPLLTMLVFSIFFGRLARIPSDGVPYPIFAFAALVPWTFFSTGLTLSSSSLVGSANLIRKVYFPRLAIPLATILSGLVDLLVASALLLVMMLLYHIVPTWRVLSLPLFLALLLGVSLGAGFWLSALNVQYRDVRYVVPFLTQFWMFATPIAYPSSLVHGVWRSLYAVNPLVSVVEGFRWALLGSPGPTASTLIVSSFSTFILLTTGALYFRKMEQSFADVV